VGASQVRSTSYDADMPVPVSEITAAALLDEVLLMVSVPAAKPSKVGSNSRFNVADCPGVSVAGNVGADIVKPTPTRTAELTVTEAVPVEVRVTV